MFMTPIHERLLEQITSERALSIAPAEVGRLMAVCGAQSRKGLEALLADLRSSGLIWVDPGRTLVVGLTERGQMHARRRVERPGVVRFWEAPRCSSGGCR